MATCVQTQVSQVPPQPYGRSRSLMSRSPASSATDVKQDEQARMPPGASLPLIYVLMVLVVLNVEIVVPTADQYAARLGASESFSGLVIALTPIWQGILGVPLNYLMLKSGMSMKNMIILMVAFSVMGNILYALAGLMHSKFTILASRTLIGICQCQLAGPIYIARAVGVKLRTKVMFIYSTMAAIAFFSAPWIASMLEIFVKELRIEDLVLDSDTIPGWFMATLYFIYLLLVVFFFEDARVKETPVQPEHRDSTERFLTPGLAVCFFASFISPTTTTMCIVFFVKLAEKTLAVSVSATGLYLGCAMAFVALVSFASMAVTPYLEDRRGLLVTCLCACISSILTFHLNHAWDAASITLFMCGFLLLNSFSSVVKNYGYALVPKVVAPQFKDQAGTLNMIALQLGRGLGAQLGAVMNTTSFAASQVGSYLVLSILVAVFYKQLKQHDKAM